MNATIHPELTFATFTCSSCGTVIETHSTGHGQSLEVCSNCHPAYTGRQRSVATGSRIERFERRARAGARVVVLEPRKRRRCAMSNPIHRLAAPDGFRLTTL